MKFGRSPPSVVTGKPEGFYDLARAHVAAHGGRWFIVDRRQTPQQWRAWMAYFAWLDDQPIPRGRKVTSFRGLDAVTVPAEWPLDFDASAPPAPPPEPREEPISPARRKQLADMLRGIVVNADPRERRAPTFRDMTAPQAEDRITKLTADYAAAPPQVVTPAMREYLGRWIEPTAPTPEELTP
jgi:hypothetical protein